MNRNDLMKALGELEPETVFNARVFTPARTRRFPMGALIAAVLALLLAVGGAAAAGLIHSRTARLIAASEENADPKESELLVIDRISTDYELTVQDGGLKVTLHSAMGCTAEDTTLLYLTLSVDPETGTLPEDLTDYGFWRWLPDTYGTAGGETTILRNEDGSADVMLFFYCDQNLQGQPLDLTLRDFGCFAKGSDMEAAYPGIWSFRLPALSLGNAQVLTGEGADFSSSLLKPKSISVSPLGGALVLENSFDEWYTAKIQAHSEALALIAPEYDWRHMTTEQFDRIYISGTLTSAQLEQIFRLVDETAPEEGAPGILQLVYPEGEVVSANTTVWWNTRSDGSLLILYRFAFPQDISQGEALVLDGRVLPLK